jgi:AcrR family transcriptional regulator
MPKAAEQTAGALRKERAAATRRRMIEASYRMFCERGWGVPLTAIAEEAGVAVQTLYFTFHNKATLLQHALQFAVLGDELPLGPHQRPWFQEMEKEPDQRRAFAMVVDNTLPIYGRTAPLSGIFLSGEPQPAALWVHSEKLRIDGYRVLLQALIRKGGLKPGLSEDEALDIMFNLLSPQSYQAFVITRGWSDQRWAELVKEIVPEAIFPPGKRRR